MISVIIPTLWKAPHIQIMLPRLLENKYVGEVIIIDNAKDYKFFRLPNNDKLKVLEQKENIFVNPAWNLGFKESKFDKLCFMNDDIVFDDIVFEKASPLILEKNGVIGPHTSSIKHFYISSQEIIINPCKKFTHGYGTLLFVHKKNYYEVPSELRINFGDVWLYDYNALQKRQNYEIQRFCVKTKMNTTSVKFNEITEHEDMIYPEVFKRLTAKKGNILSDPLIYDLLTTKEYSHSEVLKRLGINA